MTSIMTVFGELVGGLGNIVAVVTSNDMLQIGIAAAVGGIAISWFRRLTMQGGKRRR